MANVSLQKFSKMATVKDFHINSKNLIITELQPQALSEMLGRMSDEQVKYFSTLDFKEAYLGTSILMGFVSCVLRYELGGEAEIDEEKIAEATERMLYAFRVEHLIRLGKVKHIEGKLTLTGEETPKYEVREA